MIIELDNLAQRFWSFDHHSFDHRGFAAALAALAAQVPKAAEPVAVVCEAYVLRWEGTGPIAPLIRRNGIKVGDKLYAAPQAPAAQPLTEDAWVIESLIAAGHVRALTVGNARCIFRSIAPSAQGEQ